MKYHILNRNINGTELVVEGYTAFESACFQLMTTPLSWIPEFPIAGFDVRELFGYTEESEDYQTLCREFEEKIKELDPYAGITVEISRIGSLYEDIKDTVLINITYLDEKGKKQLPIKVQERNDGEFLTYFRDIRVK